VAGRAAEGRHPAFQILVESDGLVDIGELLPDLWTDFGVI
jgi:hypothetical protein